MGWLVLFSSVRSMGDLELFKTFFGVVIRFCVLAGLVVFIHT